MRRWALLVMALSVASTPATADAPAIATDIPPVHSLVARVMLGVGEPALVLPPGGSPHGHAMRPSEAAALDEAELVVWIGPTLTPWLARAIETLAPEARSLPLLGVDGTFLLDFRDGPALERHGNEEDEAGHATEHGQDHEEGDVDPHAWLDPENARLWLAAIADALAAIDPENAAAYRSNAADARAQIEALTVELAETLEPVRDRPFIVFHDAYHYFEHRFRLEAAGAVALSDAAPPGPSRVSAVRELIASTGAACVFAEPQFPPDLIATVTEGTEARAATLDPLGAGLEPGPGLYPQMMRGLAEALRGCLDPAG